MKKNIYVIYDNENEVFATTNVKEAVCIFNTNFGGGLKRDFLNNAPEMIEKYGEIAMLIDGYAQGIKKVEIEI